MKNSHRKAESTKNLQEAEDLVLTATNSPLRIAIMNSIAGGYVPVSARCLAMEALGSTAKDLFALHIAASNGEMPLADEHVNDAIYRIAERASAAEQIASRMSEIERQKKNGGAK